MVKVHVKNASLDEVMQVNKLIPEFKGETKKEFEERLNGKEKLLIVALINKKNAGYLVGYGLDKKSFYIWMAGVIPKYRRRGVMTKLMDYAEKAAKKKGYLKVKIKTRNSRRAQLANLIKRNYMFTEVESEPKLIENRIFLEKELI